MPTYQYACTQCDERLEAVQSFSDPALVQCPQCGGRLRKVYGSVGVVFKGSGFYKNDSRKAGSGESPSTDGKPAEGKPAESKPGEAKPAESKPTQAKPAESKPTAGKPSAGKPSRAPSTSPAAAAP